MSANPYVNFERQFSPGDEAAFGNLTRGLVGARCVRCRETFADGLILDFGKLVPEPDPRSPKLPDDRGEWVLSTWGCDVVGSQGSHVVVDSGRHDFKAVKDFVSQFVDSKVKDLTLNPADLSLTITFSNATRLELRTDRTDPELDQWFIELPTRCSVGVSASGRWYVHGETPS